MMTAQLWPRPSSAVLASPGVGYVTYGTTSAVDTSAPSSTMYVRYLWQDIEPVLGSYVWTAVDTDLAAATAAGQRLGIRIMPYSYQTDPGVTSYSGLAGISATWNGVTKWVPNLDDATVRTRLGALIAAIAARYGAVLGIIDVGFVGSYGEFHFAGPSPTPAYPSNATLRWLFDLFAASFAAAKVIVGGDLYDYDLDAFDYALDLGFGLRLDSWGNNIRPGWNQMDNKYPAILARAGDFWCRAPLILEPYGTWSDWVAQGRDWQESLTWAVDRHASLVSNNFSSTIPPAMAAGVTQMLTRVGYRIVISKISFTSEVVAGGATVVTVQAVNGGNAPIYEDTKFRITVGGHDYDSAAIPSGAFMGDLTAAVTVGTTGLSAGRYPMQISLVTVAGAPLAIATCGSGATRDCWYLTVT